MIPPLEPIATTAGRDRSTGWLTGKVALVAGGAAGIGRAVVDRFVQEGAQVCLLDIDQAGLYRTAERWGKNVVAVEGDVRHLEDHERAVRKTVEAFGRLDIYVGNAGMFDGFVRLADLPAAQVEDALYEVMDVNVKGYILGARVCLGEVVKSRGNMVFTVSNAGLYAGGGGVLYAVSKHAVVGLIRQLAHELAPKVRVNGVAPGGTLTNIRVVPSLRALARDGDHHGAPEERIKKANPLQIAMRPEDHAAAYVFLASDHAHATTGIVIESDGGLGVRGLWSPAGGQDL